MLIACLIWTDVLTTEKGVSKVRSMHNKSGAKTLLLLFALLCVISSECISLSSFEEGERERKNMNSPRTDLFPTALSEELRKESKDSEV